MFATACHSLLFTNIKDRVEVSIRLRRAVVRNDLALVKRVLKTYPDSVHDVDQSDKSNTPLHVAAREGFDEIVEFIVTFTHEQEVVDKRSSKGHSYLSRRCRVGLAYNTDDQTPMHCAAARSHPKITELLCKHFPQSIEKHDKEGRTPLHLASQAQPSLKHTNPAFSSGSRKLEDTSTLQVLLAHHADVRAVDKVGSTCLHYATAWGNLKAVRVLVQAGADPLARNNAGWMPQYYSLTVQAEVYYRNLVAEWEKRQAEEEMRHRQRVEAERGGVRLVVSEEDEGTEGTESDDGRNRADSGNTHFTTASEGGLGISIGRTDSWK